MQPDEGLFDVCLGARSADLVLEATQDDGHARELLAQVVVQVPRDTRAFVLLGVDQAAGEVRVLLVRLAQRLFGASFLFDDNREQHQRSGGHQEEELQRRRILGGALGQKRAVPVHGPPDRQESQ